MNEVAYQKDYEEFKQELNQELNKTAEGFVKIGYLLKVARDTNILLESGYDNVVDFAKAEYGIDKTQVSRFISINDKFAEDGYSDRLKEGYRGIGYAKLTIMLQLPDAINEEITPSFSKAEIQTIKEELDEEKAVSDLEVMMEPVPEAIRKENEQLMKVVIALGEAEPELYTFVYTQAHLSGWDVKALQGDMVENEEKIYSVRVPGEGRYALSLKENGTVKLINMRSGDRSEHTWEELLQCWESQDLGMDPPEQWTCMYGKDFPKKEEPVAPVQPKKEIKVTKAAPKEEKKSRFPLSDKERKEKEEAAERGNNLAKAVIQKDDQVKEEMLPTPMSVPEEPRQQDSVDHKICINDNENSADDNRISAEPEYIEAEYKEVEEIQENVNFTKVDEERAEEKNDLLEYSRMTVALLTRCLNDWEDSEMPIGEVRHCLQNMSELKETLEKLEEILAKEIGGNDEK